MKKHLHALTAWMLIVMLLVSNTVNVMAVEPVTGGQTDVFSELAQSTEMDDDALTGETEPESEDAAESEAPSEESTEAATEESTEGSAAETSAEKEDNAADTETTAGGEETESAAEQSENASEAETEGTAETHEAVSSASDITKDEEINPNGDYLYELSATSTDGKVVVTATMDESAGIETGTTIHAEPITGARLTYVLRVAGEAAGVEKDNAYGFAYDVYFLKNGKRVEPNESIHISMQYTEPMTIDIPAGSEVQSLQFCHIHNKDVEVLDSAIDAEDNAVSAAEFDLSSFSPVVMLASVETVEKAEDAINLGDTSKATVTASLTPTDAIKITDTITISLSYTIQNDAKSSCGSRQAYYTVPVEYLSLTNEKTSGNIIHNNDSVGTYQIDKTTGVILFTFNEDFWRNSEVSGTFTLYAKLIENKITNEEKVTVSFPGVGTVDINLKPGEVSGEKKASGGIQYDESGKAYVDYDVKFKVSDRNVEDLVIWDVLDPADKMQYAANSFKFDNNSITSSQEGGKDVFKLSEVAVGEHHFTYRVYLTLDTTKAESFKNTVYWNWKGHEGNPYSKEETVSTKMTSVEKSGSTEDGLTASWTVKLKPGFFTSKDAMQKAVYVDTPQTDSGMKYVSGSIQIKDSNNSNKVLVKDTDYTITEKGSGFTVQFTYSVEDSGKVPSYVITYKTKMPEGTAAPTQTVTYKNTAKFTPKDESEVTKDGSAKFTYKEDTTGVLTKQANAYDADSDYDVASNTAVTSWTVTVNPPEGGMNVGAKLEDSIESWNSNSGIEKSSIKITDEDGNEWSTGTDYEISEKTDSAIEVNGEKKEGYVSKFTIQFKRNIDQKLTISYSAKTFALTQDSVDVKNKASIKWGNLTAKDEDTVKVSKAVKGKIVKTIENNQQPDDDGCYEWLIKANFGADRNAFYEYQSDEVLRVEDLIPDGMELCTDGAHKPVYAYADSIDYMGYQNEYQEITDYTYQNKKFSVSFTGIGQKVVWLKYYTKINNGYLETQEANHKFENKASYYQKDSLSAQTSASFTVDGKAIKKTGIFETGQETNIIDYSIAVNSAKVKLNGGNALTLTDVIPSNCDFVLGSLTVKDENDEGAADVTTDYKDGVLTVTLPDQKAFTITYRVKVKGTKGEKVQVVNTAVLTGESSKQSQTDGTYTIEEVTATATGLAKSMMVKKYDESTTQPLSGAKFKFWQLEWKENEFQEVSGSEVEKITGDDGSATFGVENGQGKLSLDTLYAFQEVEAPANYVKDDTVMYFYIAGNSEETLKANIQTAGLEVKALTDGSAVVEVANKKETVPETTSIGVKKVWADAGNQDGKRPTEVKAKLYDGSNEVTKDKDGNTISEITLNANNNWAATWSNLPKQENGTDISYTVKEVGESANKITFTETKDGKAESVEYSVSYSDPTDVEGGKQYTITNSYTPAVRSIKVEKKWAGETDAEKALRPDKVTVQLLADGSLYTYPDGSKAETELNTSNQWKASWENLPLNKVDKDGKSQKIQYSVKEFGEADNEITFNANDANKKVTYSVSYNENNVAAEPTFVITNTYGAKTVRFSKVIAGQGKELKDAELKITSGSDIIKTWTSDGEAKEFDLPIGVYQMVEDAAPAGYQKAESITFQVVKDADGNLKVQILQNGTWVDAKDATITMEDQPIVTPETEKETEPETTRSNGGNGGGSGGGGGGEWHAVTTAAATEPSTEETITTAKGGDVNGDSRDGEVETNPDGSVRGAGRGRNRNGDDGDVNGARRGALTGDQAMTLLWGAGFMCCAILLFAWVRRRKR